ncbi:RecQ family ATP-dependent DNA helicase [Schleiferilactobacillus shenzhenensis]|uniref:RecQ n=1 Tax=Schleiferilactobacillus shenzhenensis LY-73 TaxID=1231336 RepID=U4TXM4_9LACO|nr:RecQ family ATP-dependent DNA helicase [Schleiferilactobacillus shenzhenensis]ERL66568.1 RecQ [Schleiferilactobacillus shenzhenensis LY-73]
MTDLHAALQHYFGFSEFRPGQEDIIQALMAGRNVLGILPTGQGKSLTYQLPTLLSRRLTVVVSPLLALMSDQVQHLQEAGIGGAIALNSLLDRQEQNLILAHLDRWRFLFAAPETLTRPDVVAALRQRGIGLLVVDEAHCISEWGPDFRPAFLQLGTVVQTLRPGRILALTATASPRVRQDIARRLHLTPADTTVVSRSVDRPNIWLAICPVTSEAEKATLLPQLIQAVPGNVIVYFNRKRLANEAAAALVARGVSAGVYHGDLDPLSRRSLQHQFRNGQIRVVCATNAFGMGIDQPDVRAVIHMAPPTSLEDYLQAIGRAGRDGQPAAAITLLAPGDTGQLAQDAVRGFPPASLIRAYFDHPDRFVKDETPEIQLLKRYRTFASGPAVTQLLAATQQTRQGAANQMIRFCTAPATVCRRQLLLNTFDAHPATVTHDAACCAFIAPSPLLHHLAGMAWPSAAPLAGSADPVQSVSARLAQLF